jgi:hypothetical protein
MIFAPQDGATFAPGQLGVLHGQGLYLEENKPETEALAWTSSEDGDIGTGMTVQMAKLSPGAHRITLTAGTGERAGKQPFLSKLKALKNHVHSP